MSVIKISKSAYFHNLLQISAKLGGKERIFSVLKDNAYGHGISLIAPLAREFGISKAVVRDESEARLIKELFSDILILSHRPNGDESADFIYAVNDISAFKDLKAGIRVHLALDTMMHRHGLSQDQLESAFSQAKAKNIYICGAYTHFCSADELNGVYGLQKERFLALKSQIKDLCESFGMSKPLFHSHNSAATERNKTLKNGEHSDECVRVGIAQYGYAQFDESLNLKPILSLFAHKLSSRTLKAGECVGYGGAFCAQKDMEISTYDLGYGDGLFRFNAKGEFYPAKSHKARILGRISMDSFSSDSKADELCVIDDANIWASRFDTICYDILVKLMPNIPRIVVL